MSRALNLEQHPDPILQRNFDRIAEALGQVTLFDFYGNGDPEGVVTADKTATFRRLDGSSGTMLYVKTTSGVNTGWVAYA